RSTRSSPARRNSTSIVSSRRTWRSRAAVHRTKTESDVQRRERRARKARRNDSDVTLGSRPRRLTTERHGVTEPGVERKAREARKAGFQDGDTALLKRAAEFGGAPRSGAQREEAAHKGEPSVRAKRF